MTQLVRTQLVGNVEHPEFSGVMGLLRAETEIVEVLPELIVVVQDRPGAVSHGEVEACRRRSPLAGVVALLGSWSEGEARTGRPFAGVERIYWYEFPAWWRRQQGMRAEGLCPDWLRHVDINCGFPASARYSRPVRGSVKSSEQCHGLIAIRADVGETAEALGDVLQRAGFASMWQRPGGGGCSVIGIAAGLWVGAQLNASEEFDLQRFCRRMSSSAAPVIAILDFPRHDSLQRALRAGASEVFGMPWSNADLANTVRLLTSTKQRRLAA